MPFLGSRGPTQLLAEMMELLLCDEEGSCLFAVLFMQRINPPGCASCWKRTTMTMKADRLLALHGHKQTGIVALVEGIRRISSRKR
jgi:hypothetical protein